MQTTQSHGSWPDAKYDRLSPYANNNDHWQVYPSYQDDCQSSFAGIYRTNWQLSLGLLNYKYDPQTPYAFLYEYNCQHYYNSVYKYKQKPDLDKDYKVEHKLIWNHMSKNETKPILA